jgi:hypothetical protein
VLTGAGALFVSGPLRLLEDREDLRVGRRTVTEFDRTRYLRLL